MRLFVFLSILLSTSLAFAQDLHFQTLSNLNEIRATASHADTLWIGTDGGVQKRLSDGTLLATYTKNNGFPSNQVNNITIDHHGNKWFVAGYRIEFITVSFLCSPPLTPEIVQSTSNIHHSVPFLPSV